MTENYSVSQYISDIRAVVGEETDEKIITTRISPLSKRLAASPDFMKDEYRIYDEVQGFGVCMLHEEENHDLSVFVMSWLPDRGTLPHNHLTWAVVASIEGEEHEVFWQRKDDGSIPGHAEIEKTGEATMRFGDVTTCGSHDIHSVWNTSEKLSVSLHTYGRHINYTGRTKFDPETNSELEYVVAVEN